ncbi:MAG: protein kinase [Alphaproteobacteria bacterium]|jgi:serine/threonine-protein kinase|nr:protein kinase [Alphaproteobacteria bacterium]
MKSLGRYEIRDCIGEGAMANVYRAFDPQINRVLAIKVLKRELCDNKELAARFMREASAAGVLSHPNIVTIYDVGEADGYPYIAMELLEGKPLDTIEGKLAVQTVMAIGVQLTEALSYAHGLGVIHRDIKPSNIMLAKDGASIKILDFGIARISDAERALDEAGALKTQIGQVLGTPRYMSPEQALGEEIDGRSDLFSAGLVLYELITGAKAFAGSNATTLGLQIALKDPVPIVDLTPDCPRGMRLIVNKLLAKKPHQRYADGGAAAEALRREQTIYAGQLDARGRRRNLPLQMRVTLIATTVVALVLLAAIGTVLVRQYAAIEHLALTSGSSIASFVASNAALHVVDNAARPPAERDWVPLQAFVKSVSQDRNVQQMTFVDDQGVVRAATDASRIGKRYNAPAGETLVRRDANLQITATPPAADGHTAFRFVHPITYAGRTFGSVDISVSNSESEAAAALSRMLLIALGVLMLIVVCAVSYVIAILLMRPIERLKAALHEGASGNGDVRIAQLRNDEFGDLFDAFNTYAAAMQERIEAERGQTGLRAVDNPDATRVLPAPQTAAKIAATQR